MTNTLFTILLIAAMGATVGALGLGLISLAKGNDFNRRYGNVAMRWRIILQACALLIFFLMLWLGRT
jgi:uncharacterized membrane protein YozB (DUF420 family)